MPLAPIRCMPGRPSRAQEVRALSEIVGRAGLTGVDLKYLDNADDLEATELRLLARLQELGYEVERRSPSEEGAGS